MGKTETKAQRVERLKREKNPWEAFEEIRGYVRNGFPAIPPAWLGTYLRWWGVYTQGDGVGVLGGQKTALKVGMLIRSCAGVPGNFAQAAWSPVPRILPLGWMLDLWGGAILAALVAGFLYKE